LRQYLDLLAHLLQNGRLKHDRPGTGTVATVGSQLRFDLRDGFPLVTT
jgi:thymidylate synthase